MPSSTFYNENLTASTTTSNILAGDINEFVRQKALVNVYAVCSAIKVKITVLADGEIAINRKEIPNIGTTLNKKDHLVDSFPVYPNTRLSLFLEEYAAAGTIDAYTCVEIIPIP
jgi:hypothetical protein